MNNNLLAPLAEPWASALHTLSNPTDAAIAAFHASLAAFYQSEEGQMLLADVVSGGKVEITDNGDGTYTYTATFAEGIA